MINKNELKARLKQGEHLEDIFNFTDGQECLIYKGKFEKWQGLNSFFGL